MFLRHSICEQVPIRRNFYDEMEYIPLGLKNLYRDEFLYPTRLRLRLRIVPENRAAMMTALMINVTAQVIMSRFLSMKPIQPPPNCTNAFFEG